MTLRMFNGVTARLAQVVRDYFNTELANVDAEEGGNATPQLPVDHIDEWDRPLITGWPWLTMAPGRSPIYEIQPRLMGDRIHADYYVDLKFHLQLDSAGDNAFVLQTRAFRYGSALVRVLCDQKDGLETIADPTRYVTRVKLRSEIDWGVQVNQGSGSITRTVVIPIAVEKTEPRTGTPL